MAFAVSSFIIGIAGGLQGIYIRNVTAEMYGFSVTFDQLCGLFIGGVSTLGGPVLGAAFITMFPDVIGAITKFLTSLMPFLGTFFEKNHFEVQYFIYGLCIVLVLVIKPDGLNGIIRDVFKFMQGISVRLRFK
jgi:branched-chain amino acid transport system permease protein